MSKTDSKKPRILVLVPARGGSKGIPGKNIKKLGNATLLEWAITIGRAVPDTMGVYVSTDYESIANEGRRCGAKIMYRPESISQDQSTVVDMVNYHLAEFAEKGEEPDIVVYLEPTSPFRTVAEILKCIEILETQKLDAVATFAELNFHPTWLLTKDDVGGTQYLVPDSEPWSIIQKDDAVFALTGGVYVFNVESYKTQRPGGIFFGKTGFIVQTGPAIDIDTRFELETARGMLTYFNEPSLVALGLVATTLPKNDQSLEHA